MPRDEVVDSSAVKTDTRPSFSLQNQQSADTPGSHRISVGSSSRGLRAIRDFELAAAQ
jgi:hypothetical protein